MIRKKINYLINKFNFDFFLAVKYKITVKTSKHSPDEYIGNLGINIVARNFDTGFIKLDENIAFNNNKDETGERNFFRRGQVDVFQFEEQDIRTV